MEKGQGELSHAPGAPRMGHDREKPPILPPPRPPATCAGREVGGQKTRIRFPVFMFLTS